MILLDTDNLSVFTGERDPRHGPLNDVNLSPFSFSPDEKTLARNGLRQRL
jgi:hypothetical protein